nr:MAG TPA: hypothetical protein [Caudoviricetes sp.]
MNLFDFILIFGLSIDDLYGIIRYKDKKGMIL